MYQDPLHVTTHDISRDELRREGRLVDSLGPTVRDNPAPLQNRFLDASPTHVPFHRDYYAAPVSSAIVPYQEDSSRDGFFCCCRKTRTGVQKCIDGCNKRCLETSVLCCCCHLRHVGHVLIVKPILGGLGVWSELGRDAARVVLDYGVTPSFYVADGAWSGAGEVGTCAYNVSKPIAKCVGAVFFGIYGTIGISVYYMGFGTYKVLSCLGGTLVKPIVHGSGEGLKYVGEGLVHLSEDERQRLAAQENVEIKVNVSTTESGASWFSWLGFGGPSLEPERKNKCLCGICPCCCRGDDPTYNRIEGEIRYPQETNFHNYPSSSHDMDWARTIPNHGAVVFNPTSLPSAHFKHADHSQIVSVPGEYASKRIDPLLFPGARGSRT